MIRKLLIAWLACAASHVSAGELTRRFELSLERTLHGGAPRYTQELLLADLVQDSGRLFSDFSGDLSGRYLGALALAGPQSLDSARSFAPRVFALQQTNGDFSAPLSSSGTSRQDMSKLWGHGRMLVGLVEYYQATGDARSLDAARRLGDFLLEQSAPFDDPAVRQALERDQGAHGYICWTQNIEGLALLARVSGEERYRHAAASIARTVRISRSQHTHGVLSTLRGMLLLADADSAFTPQVETEWEGLVESGNVYWNGGPPEYINSVGRDEGCASADWLRLNLALWRLTGREHYLEAAENALFNGFFSNQLPTGDFGHLTFSAEGYRSGAVEAWWCCTLHGLRTFLEARASAFRAGAGELYYDLPIDGQGSVGDFEIEAEAELARDGRVTLLVRRAPTTPVTLHVRKPSRTRELRSNLGSSQEAWLDLDRVWTSGERFDIEYVFETEIENVGGAKIVRRGPWTLGVSEGGDLAYFNEGAQSHRIVWDTLGPGGRPSQVEAQFLAQAFGGQRAPVTFRPISERWETAAHSLRWTAKFEPPPRPAEAAKVRIIRPLYENRKPLAAGFAAGVLFFGVIVWLWRRRGR